MPAKGVSQLPLGQVEPSSLLPDKEAEPDQIGKRILFPREAVMISHSFSSLGPVIPVDRSSLLLRYISCQTLLLTTVNVKHEVSVPDRAASHRLVNSYYSASPFN